MITVRRVVGWAAVLGTLPYLTLKAVWLSGGTIGVADPGLFDDSSVFALNALTAAMDLVAVAVALAFTYSWGRRLPSLLVLVPIWVGTGFLAPIVILLPSLRVSGSSFLDGWVQPLVYGSFAWQGLTLAVAFVFYARERWPVVFRVGAGAGGGTVLACFGVVLAIASAVRVFSSGDIVFGGLAIAAASGAVAMRWGPWLLWVPMAIAWIGAGSLFAWGAWAALITLADTFLAGGEVWAALLDTLAGGLIGVSSLLLFSGFGDRPPCTAAFAVHQPTRGGT